MPVTIQEEIEQGWKFLSEGKEEAALKLANEIERKVLSPEEKLKLKILKGNIQFSLGQLKKGFDIAEETYREYEKLGNDFLLIDAIDLKLWFLIYQGQMFSKSSTHLVEQGEIILKSISNGSPSEIAGKETRHLFSKAVIQYNKGNFEIAMESCKKALELIEQYNLSRIEDNKYRRSILSLMGHIYTGKGELNSALEYHEKSLALKTKDTNLAKAKDVDDFWGLGYLFYLKGDLDKSLDFFKQGLKILEELNWLVEMASNTGPILSGIIRVLIAKGDHEITQQYLNLYKQINDKNPIKQNITSYKMLKAKILKSSTRPRDRAEAEKIYKEIIEKGEEFTNVGFITALSEICDLYIKELQLTNDFTIIDEIKPYISRLQENAERGISYSLHAKTKLLQARISLVQMNMGDARRLLTQAQEIADENGYQHLAQTISIEHDNLLGQLDVWENFKKTNTPISKRMNLALLNGSIENLIETHEEEIPEVLNEQPILLLILMEGGVLLLSYPFTDEWNSNDELFGSFLTAFMAFSNEFFTEGLDRAKFGDYTVLMESISQFSICYLYKGQTYLAKKKLEYFIERLQSLPSIMETLNKFYETSQVIELKKFPFLEGFITEIFMSKNPIMGNNK